MSRRFQKGYGPFLRAVPFFIAALLFFSGLARSADTPSASNASYAKDLAALALEKGLQRERMWEVLLHYKPALRGPVRFTFESLIDDPRFFLSPEGKTDPAGELDATIRAFFDEDAIGDDHPQCRFPARLGWLTETLSIDKERLPRVECAGYKEAFDSIDPKGAAHVFATAHINSPASMFGHSFVRIDSSKESRLLSYAANYAALPTDTNTFVYTYKGVFGHYKGFYSILPYYTKVQEYSDMDHRDMWEYRLDLTEAEVERMVAHLWELKDIFSYYYFFDENCSYTILFILEAARPSLHLTDAPGLSVIPIDTVRAIRDSGIVADVVFRPSRAAKIRHIASLLENAGLEETDDSSGDLRDLALDIAAARINAGEALEVEVPTEKKIMVLDLAIEYIQYLYSKGDLPEDEYKPLFLKTLKVRGTLGKQAEDLYEITPPPLPEQGHLSRRLALGIGTERSGGEDLTFNELRFRPAYHELLDPQEGYIEGSQIEFFSAIARHYGELDTIKLERFDILNILSLTPRDKFFKPLSWKLNFGLEREVFPTLLDPDAGEYGRRHLIGRLNGGAGHVFRTALGMPYVMAEAELGLSGRYKHNAILGGGVSLGWLAEKGPWKAHLIGRALYYELNDEHRSYSAELRQSLKLSVNSSLFLEMKRESDYGIYSTEGTFGVNLFF